MNRSVLILGLIVAGLLISSGVGWIILRFGGDPCAQVNLDLDAGKKVRVCTECIESASLQGMKLGSVHYARGVAYGRLGLHAVALNDFNRALELDAGSAETLSARGLAYERLGYLEKAVEDQKRAIELAPKMAKAYTRLAVAHGRMGEMNLVINLLDRAIGLDADNVEALCNRAYILLTEFAEPQKALSDLNQAVKIDKSNGKALYSRGVVLGHLGEYEKAAGDFTEVLRLTPESAPAYVKRAVIYKKLGKTAEARVDIEKARSIDLGVAVPDI